ncbi:nuclease-related domain-containing protein [Alkalibacillus haloalkaliphilus]|uniref:NERD domain-containing protein n=1 Tax=Alkalibacillus haloalkaliphilus TaxID=94136 RepID=A0A511WBF7_9BACI|nr:NERD domain-containing protein [Alkalibacillus haloalkaliphilus]GEN46642.1 hypothetical protein AHA02nite_24180 [Alkalibacillus haloalkaliphilus]
MIILPHSKPPELEQLEALVPRYKRNDQTYQTIQDRLGKELAGYLGERSLQYYIKLLNLKDHFLLFGFRAKGNDSYFQIDLLLITQSFILIIEAKHLKGTLSINESGQLIQENEDEIEVYQNPLIQANIQRSQLSHLLSRLSLDLLPIYTCVTFTHPKSIININKNTTEIFPSQNLPNYIYKIQSQNQTPLVSTQKANTIAKSLKIRHTPKNNNLINYYGITDHLIKKGVWCTQCKSTIMKRIHGNWHCSKCNHKDKTAHLQALREFAVLYDRQYITNKEARSFLKIQSESTTKRLLSKFERKGDTKGSEYLLK